MISAVAGTLRGMRYCVCVPMALPFLLLELISGTLLHSFAFPKLLHFNLGFFKLIPLFCYSGMADSFFNHHKT